MSDKNDAGFLTVARLAVSFSIILYFVGQYWLYTVVTSNASLILPIISRFDLTTLDAWCLRFLSYTTRFGGVMNPQELSILASTLTLMLMFTLVPFVLLFFVNTYKLLSGVGMGYLANGVPTLRQKYNYLYMDSGFFMFGTFSNRVGSVQAYAGPQTEYVNSPGGDVSPSVALIRYYNAALRSPTKLQIPILLVIQILFVATIGSLNGGQIRNLTHGACLDLELFSVIFLVFLNEMLTYVVAWLSTQLRAR